MACSHYKRYPTSVAHVKGVAYSEQFPGYQESGVAGRNNAQGTIYGERADLRLLHGVQQDLNLRPLGCKSWTDRVPQCSCGVPPRKIFGRDVEPSAVFLGSLLHDCYMAATPVNHLGVKAGGCPPVEIPQPVGASHLYLLGAWNVRRPERVC